MPPRKSVQRNKTLPLYVYRVEDFPLLDGYTWKELAQGYYGDWRPLPCPECGDSVWYGGECLSDRQAYPTIEEALTGIPRHKLLLLIKQLAMKSK